jgi:hypothetical protein
VGRASCLPQDGTAETAIPQEVSKRNCTMDEFANYLARGRVKVLEPLGVVMVVEPLLVVEL